MRQAGSARGVVLCMECQARDLGQWMLPSVLLAGRHITKCAWRKDGDRGGSGTRDITDMQGDGMIHEEADEEM